MRSIQRRRARPSPFSALEMAVCVRASACPSSKLSMANAFAHLLLVNSRFSFLNHYLKF